LDFTTPSELQNTTNAHQNNQFIVGTLASGEMVPSVAESPHGGPWWTQARLEDGSFLLAAGSGFQYWTRKVHPHRK
jgi:hypothetical protein